MFTRILLLLIPCALSAQESPAGLLEKSRADLLAGRYAAARDGCLKAASAFEAAGDRANQARAVTGAGLAQLYSGDYNPALDCFNRAVVISRALNDYPGEITRLNNAGTAYYYLGRYADAMNTYEQAQRVVDAHPGAPWNAPQRQLTLANIAMLHQTVGQYERALDIYSDLLRNVEALPPRERAQFLNNIGSLRRRLGDPQKALDTYREAQSIYAKAAHRDGEIAVLNNIAIVQAMDLGDFRSSIANFSEALRLAEESRDVPLAVHARLYRGEALFRAGRPAESRADFERALADAERLGEKEESWKALYGMARAESPGSDAAAALLYRAVSIIESMRQGLGASSLRSEFLAGKREVYDRLIERSNDPREVFRLMEQSRGRDLRDRLRATPELDLAKFAARVPADEIALEYWIGPTSGAVLWSRGGQFGLQRFAIAGQDARDLAALPAALADPRRTDWRVLAAKIGHMIGFDSSVAAAGIRRIRIVPDGPLASVPFEALPLDDRTLAVQRFSVAYSPALSIVPDQRVARKILWPWRTAVTAIADPAPGAGTADRAWARLPEAAREASDVAAAIGGKAAVYTGAQALKTRLASGQLAPVLHLATHAFADSRDPARSYILFAPASNDRRYDYLYRSEVYDLALRGAVDLATVSACETDAGRFVGGEGVQNFTGPFLAAGAQSVVSSLWKVDDKATAEFMTRFYSRLASGDRKDDALREAKLAFVRSTSASHPAYWAAFVLNGDAASPIPYVVKWWQIVITAIITTVLSLSALRALRGEVRTRARKPRP